MASLCIPKIWLRLWCLRLLISLKFCKDKGSTGRERWNARLPLIWKCDVTNWMEKRRHLAKRFPNFCSIQRFVTIFTSLYSEPDKSTLHSHHVLLQIRVYGIVASTSRFPYRYLPYRISGQNFASISYLFYAFYTSRPSHAPRFHRTNIVWWRVQCMQFS